jgi:hypothetical protein
MIRLTDFLTEAKVSSANLDKVADIFKRIVEKSLRTKLFRYAGPRGFVEIKNGMGILYLYDNERALRLNYIAGEIQSITMWTSFRLGKNGDFTINLAGLGLLNAGKKLIDVIRTPRVGIVKTHGELVESQFLSEAKRIAPADFAELIKNNLPPSISWDSVPWSTLSDIAIAHDFQVPTAVRSVQVPGTKGTRARYDLERLSTGEGVKGDVTKPSSANEPIYYVKITAQDPHSKKFQSVKGDKRAETILRQMTNHIENPDVKKEMKDPNSLFGIMRDLVQIVARGARNALVIYGGPGTGKTHVVGETLKDEGLVKGRDYYVIKGKVTTAALYQTLFIHRKGSILLFDDADSVWGDQEAGNILKAALDSYDERVISWLSARTVNVSKMPDHEREVMNDNLDLKLIDDPEGKIKLPSEFRYEGRIIFISNLPYEKFDSAVLTRAAKIDMTLTTDQMFYRLESILHDVGDKSVSLDVKKEILEFIKTEARSGTIDNVSMRTYVAAEDLYRSGHPNWKALLEHV